MSSKDEPHITRGNKSPKIKDLLLAGLLLLAITSEKFPTISSCHLFYDDLITKYGTNISEEAPHITKG